MYNAPSSYQAAPSSDTTSVVHSQRTVAVPVALARHNSGFFQLKLLPQFRQLRGTAPHPTGPLRHGAYVSSQSSKQPIQSAVDSDIGRRHVED
jgi:hypothetical protein